MQEKCPVCGTVMDAKLIDQHSLDVHKGSPDPMTQEESRHVPHRCVFCGSTFPTPQELKAHHASAHQR